MKRIPLTQGREALVSDCDYKYLMQWKWCYHKHTCSDSGYALRTRCTPEKGHVYLHKEVAKRKGLIGRVDHKNQDKLDDRRNNLRPATRSQNGGNRYKQLNNTSGYKGVIRDNERNKWLAALKYKQKNVLHLRFPRTKLGKIQAAFAYDVAALRLFKKHSCLNCVDHLLDGKTKDKIKKAVLCRLKGFQL